jgi:hypothetical protein
MVFPSSLSILFLLGVLVLGLIGFGKVMASGPENPVPVVSPAAPEGDLSSPQAVLIDGYSSEDEDDELP